MTVRMLLVAGLGASLAGCANRSFDPSFLAAAQADVIGGAPAAGDEPTVGTTRGPTLCCPPSTTVECDGRGNTAELAAWLDAVELTHECRGLVVDDDFTRLTPGCGATGSATVTWMAEDDCGAALCAAHFAVADRTPPTLDGPDDYDFVCDESGEQTDMARWLGSGSATDVCGATDISARRSDRIGDCRTTVVWTATDACDNRATHTAELTIRGDTSPPAVTLNGPATIVLECGIDRYVEQGAAAADTCDATLTAADIGGDRVDDRQPGTYTVRYTAVDLCGHAAVPVGRTVVVQDTLPPALALHPLLSLWPPNHDLVSYHLSDCVELVDACAGSVDLDGLARIDSIYSDEPDNATGDGNTTGDIRITGDLTFQVRAERRGNGNGRVYGIHFTLHMPDGDVIRDTCRIAVPHDQSGRAAIDDGPSAGFSVAP